MFSDKFCAKLFGREWQMKKTEVFSTVIKAPRRLFRVVIKSLQICNLLHDL